MTTVQKKLSENKSSLISNLQNQIKNRIAKMNINVRALERKAGLNVGAVNNILSGASTNPTAETLILLAEAFNCTIDELLDRANAKSKYEIAVKNFSSYSWNGELFLNIVTEFNKDVVSRNTNISSEQALKIIEEIYSYALKKNRTKIDADLIEFLLDKTI